MRCQIASYNGNSTHNLLILIQHIFYMNSFKCFTETHLPSKALRSWYFCWSSFMGMKHGVWILKILYRTYSSAITVSDNLYTLHGLATIFVINGHRAKNTDRGEWGSSLGLQNIHTYIHTYIHTHIHSQIYHPHRSDWMWNSSWKEPNCNTQPR